MMDKFIVWADGRKDEARVVEAAGVPEAIEIAVGAFGVEADQINIIDAALTGEAEYYGVSHVLRAAHAAAMERLAGQYDVEQTYYGWRARLADEADEEGGGWVGDKGHPSREAAEEALREYVRRRRPELLRA